MTEYSLTLLVCLVVIMVLAALLYAAGRGYLAALTGIGELRATLSQVLADTQHHRASATPAAASSLRRPQADLGRYKRGKKTRLVNPAKSMAGSHRSGRSTNYTFRNKTIHRNRQPTVAVGKIWEDEPTSDSRWC